MVLETNSFDFGDVSMANGKVTKTINIKMKATRIWYFKTRYFLHVHHRGAGCGRQKSAYGMPGCGGPNGSLNETMAQDNPLARTGLWPERAWTDAVGPLNASSPSPAAMAEKGLAGYHFFWRKCDKKLSYDPEITFQFWKGKILAQRERFWQSRFWHFLLFNGKKCCLQSVAIMPRWADFGTRLFLAMSLAVSVWPEFIWPCFFWKIIKKKKRQTRRRRCGGATALLASGCPSCGAPVFALFGFPLLYIASISRFGNKIIKHFTFVAGNLLLAENIQKI